MQEKSRRDLIIESFFTSKNFCDCISKLDPAHLRDDLKQEVAIILCEWPDEKIIGLFDEGKLDFYVVRVMLNMISNRYHPFHKKFRGIVEELIDDAWDESEVSEGVESHHDNAVKRSLNIHSNISQSVNEDREAREDLEDYTMDQIDSLYWYDAEMIRAYLQVGTYRGLAKLTGIPHPSCYKNIQKSLEVLRQKALAPKPLFTKEELNFIQNNKQ